MSGAEEAAPAPIEARYRALSPLWRAVMAALVLAAAWAEVKKGSHADDKAFVEAWQKTRAAALTKAGFDPVQTSW